MKTKMNSLCKTNCLIWKYAVEVPNRAFILNWVFADGPPGNAKVYDNNNYQDFHAVVPKSIPEELFWAEEENFVFLRLQQERQKNEDAARRKVNPESNKIMLQLIT